MEKIVLAVASLILISHFMIQPFNKNDTSHYEIDLHSIGKQIKKARLAKNISQAELAKAVGLSAYNIEKIEQGKAIPTREILTKIESLLECMILVHPVPQKIP